MSKSKKQCKKCKPSLFAVFLIIIGFVFLFQAVFNINIFSWLRWELVWPLLFILWGLHLLNKHHQEHIDD